MLLAAAALALGAWWASSTETRIASYRVVGTLSAVELDLGPASVEVVGSRGGAVAVRRTERFAFGRPPQERRSVADGMLRIATRCRPIVVGTCRAAYRIEVPDNVRVDVRSSSGNVRIADLNASAEIATGTGAVAIDGFCGFLLSAHSESGDVTAGTSCSPDRLELRSNTGDVRASLPSGRYRVDAQSDEGDVRVRGLDATEDASFGVQALSGSGDVVVEGER